jgi:hypothetical protein
LVALRPVEVRTRLKIRLRQEKIAPLKSFACSYRLGANSGKTACRSIRAGQGHHRNTQLSSPAKAGDPVIRSASDGTGKPRRTGYAACAGYDGSWWAEPHNFLALLSRASRKMATQARSVHRSLLLGPEPEAVPIVLARVGSHPRRPKQGEPTITWERDQGDGGNDHDGYPILKPTHAR